MPEEKKKEEDVDKGGHCFGGKPVAKEYVILLLCYLTVCWFTVYVWSNAFPAMQNYFQQAEAMCVDGRPADADVNTATYYVDQTSRYAEGGQMCVFPIWAYSCGDKGLSVDNCTKLIDRDMPLYRRKKSGVYCDIDRKKGEPGAETRCDDVEWKCHGATVPVSCNAFQKADRMCGARWLHKEPYACYAVPVGENFTLAAGHAYLDGLPFPWGWFLALLCLTISQLGGCLQGGMAGLKATHSDSTGRAYGVVIGLCIVFGLTIFGGVFLFDKHRALELEPVPLAPNTTTLTKYVLSALPNNNVVEPYPASGHQFLRDFQPQPWLSVTMAIIVGLSLILVGSCSYIAELTLSDTANLAVRHTSPAGPYKALTQQG